MRLSATLASIALATSFVSAAEAACSSMYGQCGGRIFFSILYLYFCICILSLSFSILGVSWNGPKCCDSGLKCEAFNPYYSQCIQDSK